MSGILEAQQGGPYQPLVFSEQPPDSGMVRRVAAALLNGLSSGDRLAWKAWRNRGQLQVEFDSGPGSAPARVRTALTFDELCAHLGSRRSLDLEAVRLPDPNANWADASVELSVPAHAPSNQRERHLTHELSSGFGVFADAIPALDREGVAYSNVLLRVQSRVVRLRRRLVENSRTLFQLDGDWHQDLGSYLDALVSAVDATLSRVFHRARHQAATLDWKLDTTEYPSARTIPRDERMFTWLSQLTGRDVVDRHREYAMFDRLRDVRHHLHHFDPPVFAMSIDDAAEWLNLGRAAGGLLLSIREGLRLPPSLPLIASILAPSVTAVPRAPSLRRYPQPKDAGYSSCRRERPLDTRTGGAVG